jgi:hypothetical protein
VDDYHPMFPLTASGHYYFSVLGRALYTAQRLEVSCKSLAGLLSCQDALQESGWSILGSEDFVKKVAKVWCVHLARIIELIGDGCPTIQVSVLVAAKDARNEIAHSVARGIVDVADIDACLESRLGDVTALVRTIAAADRLVNLTYNLLIDDSYSAPEYLQEYEQLVVEWVLADVADTPA